MVELLKALLEIESVSGNEEKKAQFLCERLEKHFPGAVYRIDRNVIVHLKGEGKSPTLLLCSHIDTVFPAANWTKNPFKSETVGEQIFGLGSNDAHGALVAMIEGAKRAIEKGQKLKGGLLMAFVCEEEKGSAGFFTIEPKLPRYDFAIFGEPTEMKIGYAMRGYMKLKMFTRGKAAHASRPNTGENAVFNLLRDLEKLRSLPLKDSSPWGSATVQPTTIAGGSSENQLPDLVETMLDVRTTPEIDNSRVLELLQNSGLEFEVVFNRRRPTQCDPNSPLIKGIKAANPKAELYAFQGTCDMAFTTAPSVVMGPGKPERSHTADEFVLVSELEAGAEIYKRVSAELLG